ncbi:unnamed protein product [Paramecium sonneborni]|uniref:Uncharacterized protein n=1 Tax=Paramecium sonneborni TaxID=65129 RepID=A0A8S1RHI4_9CILI|nr:unnamed protein product [Paramecium sonneborni]
MRFSLLYCIIIHIQKDVLSILIFSSLQIDHCRKFFLQVTQQNKISIHIIVHNEIQDDNDNLLGLKQNNLHQKDVDNRNLKKQLGS